MIQETETDNTEWDSTVKGRQRLFVLNYCTVEECLFNATESYRQAYTFKDAKTGKVKEPEKQTCEVNGSKLLKKPNVKLAIKRLFKTAQQDIDDQTVYKVLKDMVLGATFNPSDVLQANGKLKTKTLAELGEKAKLIAQIKNGKYGVEYTLIDRKPYLDMAIKYLQLVREETKIDVTLPVIELTPKVTDDENETAVEKWNQIANKE